MKKIREILTEYYHDKETGAVTVKTIEKRLISDKNGEDRWETTNTTTPIV